MQRVRAPATRWPPMQRLAALSDGAAEDLARRMGAAMGRELAALGFDIDFAPVLDVNTNPDNPIIGDRAFASEPEAAARRALAFAAGLADAGILSCGKHFPGHGDTDQDSHFVLPRLRHDLDRLRRVELVPFAARGRGRRADDHDRPCRVRGARRRRAGHAVAPRARRDPARRAGLPRRRGQRRPRHEGDRRHIGAADAAVRAIEAGCDVLLLCRDRANQEAAFESLVRAGESSSALRTRIAEAAAAVRRLKASPPPTRPDPVSVLGAGASLLAELDAAG